MSTISTHPQLGEIAKITKQYSVSGELTESELSTLVAQGLDTLINVRPDNEDENQIGDQAWRVLAQKYNLHYVFIPVKSCQYTEHDIEKFKKALAESSKSAHCFCRTGTRAVHLWALANKQTLSFDEMQGALKSHGYDLNMIKESILE